MDADTSLLVERWGVKRRCGVVKDCVASGVGVSVLVDRVRAGAQPYFGPRPRVGSVAGDKMFDGVIPLGRSFAAARSF